ncbi:unnamed protein product [Linum tenue]|uniref:Homeobox domain-containing protein n=1 Tax=Linum tenue TaxID=586396 RepID=A0AAV0L4U8_9ROSI|nr:unnamed protein product [Linum tenue]
MLLPDGYAPPSIQTHPTQFSWVPDSNPSEISGVVEGQGLSLSLSSSLQHLEAAKAEELRIGDGGGLLYYNHQHSAAAAAHYYKTIGHQHHQQQQQQALHLHQQNQVSQIGGFGSGLGVVNVLRSSKYVKAAAELLEEFCSVGRGQFKKIKLSRLNSNNSTNNGGGGGGSSSTPTTKESPAPPPPLSSSDRMEHQRRKVKLVSMLDEVDRRYNHYCEQMQMVVNSFDLVMGFGAAVPYTALAQKAMSRHFRCLKDAIAAQLRQTCELLGEKDAAGGAGAAGGITRGETPRLRALEQSLRQQRAFHQMGMMEQEAWRPQRGLPERSVNILRAWLFEHFLHPYPSDADKHLLARQTGLSRNQVSNWFINARVRLWKPMIEEMYQQESKEDDDVADTSQDRETVLPTTTQSSAPITPTSAAATSNISSSAATTLPPVVKGLPEIPDENDDVVPPSSSSLAAMNNRQQHYFSDSQAAAMIMSSSAVDGAPPPPPAFHEYASYGAGGMTMGGDNENFGPADVAGNTLIRYGTTGATAAAGGDVSLTLGLRHAGNVPEKASSAFSIRDFGDC